MSVIAILLPVALLLSAAAVIAFIRAVRAGQFDDLETPRWRVLTDEDPERDRSRGREPARRVSEAPERGGETPVGGRPGEARIGESQRSTAEDPP